MSKNKPVDLGIQSFMDNVKDNKPTPTVEPISITQNEEKQLKQVKLFHLRMWMNLRTMSLRK